MEKLERYKKDIANRISILLILCILALLAILFGNFYLKNQFPLKENITDYVMGFFAGIEVVFLFYMGVLIKAYRNEDDLREMYIKETDEREILIKMKSGGNIVPLLSMLIAIVSLVVAYVSYEAFIALTAVALGQIIISVILKIYWSKKI